LPWGDDDEDDNFVAEWREIKHIVCELVWAPHSGMAKPGLITPGGGDDMLL
jgi:hypothetical protein